MAGEFWRVTIFGVGGGANVQTVLHFERDELVLDAETVCNIVDADLLQFVKSRIMASGFSWTAIKAEAPGAPDESPFVKGVNIAASGPSGLSPMQVAVVWNLFTGDSGRSARGRIFWPAVSFSHITDGRLNSVGIAQHNACIAQVIARFKGPGAASGLDLVVRSRKQETSRHVTTIAATNIFGTLRTRRVGVGF